MTMPKPLDFQQVEVMRKHMLIPVSVMAFMLGATRMTYYKWVTGASQIRPRREVVVRAQIKKILAIMTEHAWPTPEVVGMESEARIAKLLALFRLYE